MQSIDFSSVISVASFALHIVVLSENDSDNNNNNWSDNIDWQPEEVAQSRSSNRQTDWVSNIGFRGMRWANSFERIANCEEDQTGQQQVSVVHD